MGVAAYSRGSKVVTEQIRRATDQETPMERERNFFEAQFRSAEISLKVSAKRISELEEENRELTWRIERLLDRETQQRESFEAREAELNKLIAKLEEKWRKFFRRARDFEKRWKKVSSILRFVPSWMVDDCREDARLENPDLWRDELTDN